MKKWVVLLIAMMMVGLIFWSCSDDGPTNGKNNLPVMESLTASSTSVFSNETITITCEASDEDGDILTYTWSTSGGVINGTDASITWTAPSIADEYKISVTVSDSKGTAVKDLYVVVEAKNSPPVIENIVSDSTTTIYPNNSTLITCNAIDPEGDPITYTWDKTSGDIIGTGSSVTWIAPGTTGSYTITCTINDGEFSDTETKVIYVTNTALPEGFILIPGGTFQMGDHLEEGYFGETPAHSVKVNLFLIGKNEVTQKEWIEIMENNPASGYGVGESYPIYNISWYAVIKYCNLRSMAEGLMPVYVIDKSTDPADWGNVPANSSSLWDGVVFNTNANGYRLPTEAEWEYAARGGLSGKRFTNGMTISHNINSETQANYYGSTSSTYDLSYTTGYHPDYNGISSPVGTFSSNGFGLHDMCGNVWEWCWDWHSETYYELCDQLGTVTDPKGPPYGSSRVKRGGSWGSTAAGCRISLRRFYYGPYYSSRYVGFRLARTP
ncbi:MAG: SUMF1/EgtB/PvdO family nonheme iron enzyme [Candidatus Delongbacteria bacterium]